MEIGKETFTLQESEVRALGVPYMLPEQPLTEISTVLRRAEYQIRLAGADLTDFPAGAMRNQQLAMQSVARGARSIIERLQQQIILATSSEVDNQIREFLDNA
ncbi:MAG: hypothetical protein NVS1B7_5940 [Candidatus Saccharimonadales bacterium]